MSMTQKALHITTPPLHTNRRKDVHMTHINTTVYKQKKKFTQGVACQDTMHIGTRCFQIFPPALCQIHHRYHASQDMIEFLQDGH